MSGAVVQCPNCGARLTGRLVNGGREWCDACDTYVPFGAGGHAGPGRSASAKSAAPVVGGVVQRAPELRGVGEQAAADLGRAAKRRGCPAPAGALVAAVSQPAPQLCVEGPAAHPVRPPSGHNGRSAATEILRLWPAPLSPRRAAGPSAPIGVAA